MDTSAIYIKMCEKAHEIQNVRKHSFSNGDYYDGDEIYFVPDELINNQEENCFGTEKGNHIWSPRQDQLQDMIKGGMTDKLNKFYGFIYPPIIKINTPINKEIAADFAKAWKESISGNVLSKTNSIILEESSCDIINVSTETYYSFEQLWLAFVMKENFNKIWNFEKEGWEVTK